MSDNNLIVAAAGSGKTEHLIGLALSKDAESVLITTFTEANEKEIRNRITARKGYIPNNIRIQTWFSFLLQHGVRPYQSVLDPDMHEVEIGFFLTSQKSGQKVNSNGEPILVRNRPLFWGEKDVKKFYFTSSFKIYSDKISKFVCAADQLTKGEVLSRISRIFNNIYIDEVQDLAGYDLEIVKLLFKSDSSVILVGDPRQVTYSTHHSKKYGKYADGRILSFVENELGPKVSCRVDAKTLGASHRNNQEICDFSAKLYPNYPRPVPCKCEECRVVADHVGVFIVRKSMVDRYLHRYNPLQLRWNSSSKINPNFNVRNFGESKGVTVDRVLIYPTNGMKKWIKDNDVDLKNEVRAKLYVALTRARYSAAIVMDDDMTEPVKGADMYDDNA